ncbi:unnamed protein product, partial [Rotaria sp. Silwood2]
RKFYGSLYKPSASLQDPTIGYLCCDTLPNREFWFQEVVKGMLADVNNFESHGNIVTNDGIGYKEQENLRFSGKYDIFIENSDDYFNRIKREIDDRLIEKNSEKRDVLVFLPELRQKLIEFYNSDTLVPIKDLADYLTEETSLKEKRKLD